MRVHFVLACAMLLLVASVSGCGGDAGSSEGATVVSVSTPPPPPAKPIKGAASRVKLMPGAPAGALPKPAN